MSVKDLSVSRGVLSRLVILLLDCLGNARGEGFDH